ncbi:HTTM domain-containing protein [Myroides sp. LJL116]
MFKKAFYPMDNSALIVFRIIFGFLFACESFGAIATGWVRDNLVEVKMTFSFIHMDFLQVLVGPQMYVYFGLMGIASLGVMLGYRYRLSIILVTLLWAGAYFLQKTSYNNHYYLLLIISLFMCFLPANDYCSLDVKNKRHKSRLWMPVYVKWLFIGQIFLVYFYGTLAKFYPDWLNGDFIGLMYQYANIPDSFKAIFTEQWFVLSIAYLGILFDALIVPLLLYKPTRNYAFFGALVFHLFNSITLQIGIFPYFALSFAVFFYSPSFIRSLFLKRKPALELTKQDLETKYLSNVQLSILGTLFVIQILLPLRGYLLRSDMLWTDQAHRLSWRMMLRSRSGYTYYTVEDKNSKKRHSFDLDTMLTPKQQARLNTPDMIWQMAQVIKKHYAQKGQDVQVFARSYVSINNRTYRPFVDSEVDLASQKWDYFWPATWILDKPEDLP